MLQEETIRRLERERKTLNEKMEALETSLAQSDAERRQLKDKVGKLQLNDSKIEQEKEAMRSQIENAESRITRIDLKKRGVEGEYSAEYSIFSPILAFKTKQSNVIIVFQYFLQLNTMLFLRYLSWI